MTSLKINYDPRYDSMTECEILADLTPNRRNRDKIYLCKCNVCGKTFTRCRKTLAYHHSDCGCVSHNMFRTGIYTDKLISGMSFLAKKVFLAKLTALGLTNAANAFQALYIDNRPYGEYTAISINMSMAPLYRARRTIHKLWGELKNDLM